jgi:hypothetical protein
VYKGLSDLLTSQVAHAVEDLFFGEQIVPGPQRRRAVLARGIGELLPDLPGPDGPGQRRQSLRACGGRQKKNTQEQQERVELKRANVSDHEINSNSVSLLTRFEQLASDGARKKRS